MSNVPDTKLVEALEKFRAAMNDSLSMAQQLLTSGQYESACEILDKMGGTTARTSVKLRGILLRAGKVDER